jgi:excisionase family DNA binding protein
MSKKPAPEGALFVRLPTTAVQKLDRAADALGMRKKDLVAGLIDKYVGPDRPTRGSYSFRPYEPPSAPEVMSVEQAAEFLQVDEAVVLELAEAGRLPARKLGSAWRFSRAALVEWLSKPEKR